MDKLLSLDIYGVEPQLFFNKQTKYRSFAGVAGTLVTACLTAMFTFFFGIDFFFRTNAIVVSQERIEEKSPVIFPTSESFPVFFSAMVSNQIVRDPDEFVLSFYFSYSYVKRDKEGKLNVIHYTTIKPKQCSRTGAAKNPLMEKYNLDEMMCLDWEELAEINGEAPRIGGTFEEDEFALYRLMVDNCEVDFPKNSCKSYLSYTEFSSHIGLKGITVIPYFPTFYLNVDSLNNPVVKSFESKPYNIRASSNTIERRTFEISTFDDDIGWISKDIVNYESMRQNRLDIETSVNFEENIERKYNFYQLLNYLGRKTSLIRRRFMKIQELVAMVGGFVKVITIAFSFAIGIYVRFKMNLIYLQRNSRKTTKETKVLTGNFTTSSVKTIKPSFAAKSELSFGEYMFSLLRCKKHDKREKYDESLNFLKKQLDILSLIDLQTKVQEIGLAEGKKV